jgi:hypothetical protein
MQRSWLHRIITYNIQRCFYLGVLSEYGAPELTPFFCKIDDWIMEALPPSIILERRKTLGRGDELCDFRWRRARGDRLGERT